MAGFLTRHAYATNRGFSLVEALVSLLVLSIGMLGLGQLQARLWASQGDLQRLNRAYQIAHNHLLLIDIIDIFTITPPPGATGPGEYRQLLRSQHTEALKSVSITLDWHDARHRNTLTLQTIVSREETILRSRSLIPLP